MYKILSRFDNIVPTAVLLSVLIAIISILLVGSADRIKGLFGFETKQEVVTKYEEQRSITENLLEDRSLLETKLLTTITLTELTDTALLEKEKSKQIITTFTDETISKKDQKIKSIKVDFKENQQSSSQNKTIKKTTSKEKEISKVQIASIWDTYCEFNQDQQCENHV